MTKNEYWMLKEERDIIVENVLLNCRKKQREGVKKNLDRLMTITRVLDRAAKEYAEHVDDAQYEGRNEQA